METSFKTNSLSIVVPVFNSEDSLGKLFERLKIILPSLTPNYEVILVNDGSRDRSWEVISSLRDSNNWIRGINLMRNYGQHNALLCGIRAAKFNTIVTIDDDLQNPPEEIVKLLSKLEEGYDVVYGTPQIEQHDLWRNLASQVTKLALQSTMGIETARQVSAFRAFRTYLRNAFDSYQSPFVSIDVLLTWATNRFTSVPVQHEERKYGASNYTFRKLVIHALNMITGFSVLPLRLASLIGFGFALFGGLVLVYVVGRFLIQGGVVPGFAFLASTIAIFSGVQLFALGIIGEYLARMYYRLMDRPSYVIKPPTSFDEIQE
jgi:undecaprenyl-phosphate 4-deoxy-4-formamido-L-arabinose transferase